MSTQEPTPKSMTPDHSACRTEELALRERLLSNDPAAWRTFDAKYGRLITATISKIVGRFGSHGTSDDVREVQGLLALEMIANEKAKLRAFDPARGIRLTSWVSLLAAHAAYDFLRRRRREPASDGVADADCIVSEIPDPHAVCELRERAALVETVVSGFSAKDRQFVELYFDEELEPTEVADRMGISVNTVYSKRHKIQGRLAALLGPNAPLAA